MADSRGLIKDTALAVAALALTACLGQKPARPASSPAVPEVSTPTPQTPQPAVSPTACVSAEDYDPQWSGDGARIYYLKSLSTGVEELHVMTSSGSDDRLLGQDMVDGLPSPDGSMVLYSDASGDPAILDTSSLTTRKIPSSIDEASWSPDGKWLLYIARVGQTLAVFKLNVAGGVSTRLADLSYEGYVDPQPRWSPDGRRIAFAARTGPGENDLPALYIANADGSDLRLLSAPRPDPGCPADEGDSPMSWLPDGSGLVYARICGIDPAAHIVTLGGVDTDLSALGRSVHVEVSVDGRHILFIPVHETANFGDPLTVANLDGSNQRVLEPKATSPSWSPDGTRIVFSKDIAARRSAIFTIKPDGSGLTQLTQNSDAGICQH